MSQVFSDHRISQELAGLDQMGLGVLQSNGHEAIEVERVVTLVRRSYSSADPTVVVALNVSRRERRRVENCLLF